MQCHPNQKDPGASSLLGESNNSPPLRLCMDALGANHGPAVTWRPDNLVLIIDFFLPDNDSQYAIDTEYKSVLLCIHRWNNLRLAIWCNKCTNWTDRFVIQSIYLHPSASNHILSIGRRVIGVSLLECSVLLVVSTPLPLRAIHRRLVRVRCCQYKHKKNNDK